MIITITEFPTHIAKTDNKIAPNKMIKLNNQSIYNGSLNRFGRAIVMNNLHSFIAKELEPYLLRLADIEFKFPISIRLEVHTVVNHGSISMRSGKICWKPAKSNYKPNWDIENLSSIWIKALNDTLTNTGVIPDDNIYYVDNVSYKYIPVEKLEDRKLIIKIDE